MQNPWWGESRFPSHCEREAITKTLFPAASARPARKRETANVIGTQGAEGVPFVINRPKHNLLNGTFF